MPYGTPDICLTFYFSLKQIVESYTEINSLQLYNNLFGCFEVLVPRKLRQTAVVFYKKTWKI